MWALLLTACATPAPAPASRPAVEDATVDADLTTPAADPAKKLPKVATANRKPKITSLAIEPASPTSDTDLRALVETTDPDNQYVRVGYQWYVNGDEVMGAISDELRSNSFRPGDRVRVDVVADDGEATDQTSSEVTVQNRAPVILTEARELTRLNAFQLRAQDPDGGPLTWSLSGGPAGLEISSGGMLSYAGSETEPGGSYTVQIRCEDEAGGWARVDVPITVSPGSKAPKPE